jgi:hypothetical protein
MTERQTSEHAASASQADVSQAPARQPSRWAMVSTAGLLAAVTIAWAASPVRTGHSGTRLALIVAVGAGILSIARLAVGDQPWTGGAYPSPAEQLAARLVLFLRALPWAEFMTVAVLVLEALHPSRPWHTGLLGVALLGYLLALHLAETRAAPGVLRPQLPLLAAGVGLSALAVGAAALPGVAAGQAASTVRVIAVAAAVVAAGLAVPIWHHRR